jgi:hypothetical protein
MWGILILAYVVPFWLWQLSEYSTIEARKKLYPGRQEEEQRDSRLTKRSLVWSAGMAVIVAGWLLDWQPAGAGIALLGGVVLVIGTSFAAKNRSFLTKLPFRLWLASSVVWALSVVAGYLVFGRVSDLYPEEFLLLGLLPPFISGLGVVAWHWAKRSS